MNVSNTRKTAARRLAQSAQRPRPQKTFPFMRLPAELREMVYEYLLVPANVCISHTGELGPPKAFTASKYAIGSRRVGSRRKGKPFLGKNGVAVLRASRLIYSETLPILYGKNNFTFTTSHIIAPFFDWITGGKPTARHPGSQHIAHLTFSSLNFRSGKKKNHAIAHLAALRNLKTLSVEAYNDASETRLAEEAWSLVDPFAPAEAVKAQFDKISFVCNDVVPDEKMAEDGTPPPVLELPSKCKAKLAELASITLES